MNFREGDGESGMNDENIITLFWERSEAAIDETKKKYGSFLYMLAKICYKILGMRKSVRVILIYMLGKVYRHRVRYA